MRRVQQRPRADAQGDAARGLAIDLLVDLEEQRLDHLADHLPESGPDAGLIREMALGAVRWDGLYDAVCRPFLRGGGRQPAILSAALRIGCHQLLALDRVPPHAAVSTTVGALRQRVPGLAGVANAVLRRIAELRLDPRISEGPIGRLPPEAVPGRLHERLALPQLLVDDLATVLPGRRDDYELLNHVAPLCTHQAAGAPPARGSSILRQEGPWTWWDDPREALAGPVADGHAWVQDFSQGEVATVAGGIRAGELALDLCAAPGGKSRLLRNLGARVVSADVTTVKARTLSGARLVQDGTRPALTSDFDLVLVDAPCSNSGVLGRRPEAKRRYDRIHLGSLERLQRELLQAGAALVRPGGRLVYATCSLSPRENQAVAHRLDGWRLRAERLTWPDAWHAGGYAVCLVRN